LYRARYSVQKCLASPSPLFLSFPFSFFFSFLSSHLMSSHPYLHEHKIHNKFRIIKFTSSKPCNLNTSHNNTSHLKISYISQEHNARFIAQSHDYSQNQKNENAHLLTRTQGLTSTPSLPTPATLGIRARPASPDRCTPAAPCSRPGAAPLLQAAVCPRDLMPVGWRPPPCRSSKTTPGRATPSDRASEVLAAPANRERERG
jgi:hypothetical protein